jgi:hypothetical protein
VPVVVRCARANEGVRRSTATKTARRNVIDHLQGTKNEEQRTRN